jgi:hypothetical protein
MGGNLEEEGREGCNNNKNPLIPVWSSIMSSSISIGSLRRGGGGGGGGWGLKEKLDNPAMSLDSSSILRQVEMPLERKNSLESAIF